MTSRLNSELSESSAKLESEKRKLAMELERWVEKRLWIQISLEETGATVLKRFDKSLIFGSREYRLVFGLLSRPRTGGSGFDSQVAGQTERIAVNVSPPLQCFFVASCMTDSMGPF